MPSYTFESSSQSLCFSHSLEGVVAVVGSSVSCHPTKPNFKKNVLGSRVELMLWFAEK